MVTPAFELKGVAKRVRLPKFDDGGLEAKVVHQETDCNGRKNCILGNVTLKKLGKTSSRGFH